jgi:phosphopantothenate synthetase
MPALLPVILQLVSAGITLAPGIIAAGRTEYDLLTSGTVPTAAEKAAIDEALEAANQALQSAQPAP